MRTRISTPRKVAAVVVAAILLAFASLAVARLVSERSNTTQSSTIQSTSGPTSSPGLSDALRDSDDSVDIVVIGDDAGKSVGGWLTLVAQGLGIEHDRSVDVRDWDLERGSNYLPPVRLWDAPGAPVTIWNVSVARNIDFLLDAIPRALPDVDSPVDAVMIDTGLMQAPQTLARETMLLARTAQEQFDTAEVIVLVQPVAESSLRRSRDDVGYSARKNGFGVVDVGVAFDNVESGELFNPGVGYPSVDGARIWADTVVGYLSS
ncbi:MAG: hypothetical protein WBF79_18445 [Rhodococcus sp. (in: high G+C Gram-positive bacteria)]